MRVFLLLTLIFGSIVLASIQFAETINPFRSLLFGLAPWYFGFPLMIFWWIYRRINKRRLSWIKGTLWMTAILEILLFASKLSTA